MESARLRLLPFVAAALLLLLPLLGARAQEDAELQPRALDFYSTMEDPSHEKELVSISPRPRGRLPLWLFPGTLLSYTFVPNPPKRAGNGAQWSLCTPGSLQSEALTLHLEQQEALGPSVNFWDGTRCSLSFHLTSTSGGSATHRG